MTPTRLWRVKSIAMDVARGNMPGTRLSGCIHALADEIVNGSPFLQDKPPAVGREYQPVALCNL